MLWHIDGKPRAFLKKKKKKMVDLYEKSMELREDILNIVYHAKAGHIGGDLSVVDLLIALYYDQMRTDPALADDPDRDRFVLSKGHSVEALYAVLADKGFLPKEELRTFSRAGSRLIGRAADYTGQGAGWCR